ncbi:MAG: histidinol dehydrogenase [Candidatus Omnitrophica bacterium]|nr:histidinol dehydrogenase [Candidatus Omnitrophota bacterium]MCM8828425.1 histidinol dehydrogenase [Candidatus Omnitrophota bacterium]
MEKIVSRIISDVEKKGDEALRYWTEKLDRAHIEDFRVSQSEIQSCLSRIPASDKKIIKEAAKRIERYHKKQIIKQFSIKEKGIRINFRARPVQSAGIYVPAGTAPLVSTVLMTAVPAKVAGVQQLIACSPPSHNGTIHPYITGALSMLGINKIFKAGGSQAIAAMAFGTETIPRVDVIAGPGNIFVNATKKILTGRIGIDLLAGPSELAALIDETANSDWIEADLKAQEEHKDGLVFLISTDEEKGKKIASRIKTGYLIIVDSITEGVELINRIAPEHAQIVCKDARRVAERIVAGAIFVGNYTPCGIGDYIAGPSHTLPTGGSASFESGLSVFSFLRTYAAMEANSHFFKKNGIIAERLAEIEDLKNHLVSLKIRRNI